MSGQSALHRDELRRLTNRIIHVSQTCDPSTRLPLVIIDSSAFPPPTVDLYNPLASAIISRLPQTPYALVFFACGAPNKPSWSWVAKMYATLDSHTKKNVRKIYVVHESWWVRAVTEMLRGVVSAKFKSKIIHVSSLSQLAQLLDITLINIRPLVYLHNRKVEDEITIPRHPMPVFGIPVPDPTSLPRVWTDTLNYLNVTAPFTRGVFRRASDPELLYILRDCYDRNQLVDLDDYGPNLAASVLKLYLYELPEPILPASVIPHPFQDTVPYCLDVVLGLSYSCQYVLVHLVRLLHSLASSQARTEHNSATLAACVAPSLLGRTTTKEGVTMGVRFTRLLLDMWPKIVVDDRISSILDSSSSMRTSPSAPDLLAPAPVAHSRHASASEMDIKKGPPPPPPLPRRGTSISGSSNNNSISKMNNGINIPSLYTLRSNSSNPELRSSSDPLDTLPLTPESPRFGSNPLSNMPPPPPRPPKRQPSISTLNITVKSTSTTSTGTILQPTHKANIDANLSQSPQKRTFGPQSKSIATTRRGKMVAELAKLYEEKSHSAQILVDIKRTK
ncbi:protein Ecm25p [Trichomonascus vanleenenianus]|uniref:Ecm25p n=1 Tax=Trichomonascus vanleenenianus TaxID=2268995 RepID=UPI003EC9980E